ncbi:hypothetical protein B0J11DRAFT_534236 [Dendryphion nanum]|uniref:histidine kinase n=1 Tax=Dendryphion nanum TaxID=256645 RepID=A0A9P9IHD2_9PLEO|nr:hypothetical protein B0J11DRAFT_534236 [Dendryphion nanum]
MVSYPEFQRERDLQRYYQPWLDAQNLIGSADGRGKGLTYEGYQPEISRDKALTAFAQLAALRLNVRRGMVSLIDSNRQYILAEGTKTLSMLPHRADVDDNEMWLGNTIIARYDAVCHHTFTSTYTALEGNGTDTYTTEALVIRDCREDPRFADRDYVKGEPGVRFYAGVPITTKAGYTIGVYAVSDDSPRDGLSAPDIRFMEGIAAAVMEHLELAKDRDDRNKGEQMVRGLTDFIERSSAHDARNESSNRLTTMERQTENARLEALAEDDTVSLDQMSSKHHNRRRTVERESDASRIFCRAARIIRQSTNADGVVFFDTSAAGIQGHIHELTSPLGSSDDSHNPSTTDFDTADSTSTNRRKRPRDRVTRTSHNTEDSSIEVKDFGANTMPVVESKACPVIGISIDPKDTRLTIKDFSFTEAGMERYTLKYPHGKFFSFTEEGASFGSSDERSEKSETEYSDNRPSEEASTRARRKKRTRFVPTEFLKILPNVRSLIFLPLWDPSSERWVAGGFIWTISKGRLMSPEAELPYLKAFGNTIASELARSSAQKADRAKSTFIASISHELRSPLHGILGSVEFLHDTVESSYQESLVSSIETCGKTLLDTIDHVLDYAKINKLRDASSRRRNRNDGRPKKIPGDNSILGVTTDFDLSQLVEEVCDTVCAGHNFRKTHSSEAGAFYEGADYSSNRSGNDIGESSKPEDQPELVAVTLNVEPFVEWVVRSQPGALRRTVMNLLGNALKYTKSGFIQVTLSQESSSSDSCAFTLKVEDSGKGMSDEYQQSRLYAPFSQEDPFSTGTGLGLSIVKQIVDSLHGEIKVKSTLEVGTSILVSLRLARGQGRNARITKTSEHAEDALKGKHVSIEFTSEGSSSRGGKRLRDSLRHGCRGLHMNISMGLNLAKTQPEFLLADPISIEKIFENQSNHLATTNLFSAIVVCADPLQKAVVEERFQRQFSTVGWVTEVIAQPCGPRKLARVLLDCHNRAIQARQHSALSRSTSTYITPQASSRLSTELVHRSISDTMMKTISSSRVSAVKSPLELPDPPEQTNIPEVVIESPPPILVQDQIVPSVLPNLPPIPRLLLVDDNAINLKLLVVFAKRQKLEYSEAINGLRAFETYKNAALVSKPQTKPFDFVLMDLSMPVSPQ